MHFLMRKCFKTRDYYRMCVSRIFIRSNTLPNELHQSHFSRPQIIIRIKDLDIIILGHIIQLPIIFQTLASLGKAIRGKTETQASGFHTAFSLLALRQYTEQCRIYQNLTNSNQSGYFFFFSKTLCTYTFTLYFYSPCPFICILLNSNCKK